MHFWRDDPIKRFRMVVYLFIIHRVLSNNAKIVILYLNTTPMIVNNRLQYYQIPA